MLSLKRIVWLGLSGRWSKLGSINYLQYVGESFLTYLNFLHPFMFRIAPTLSFLFIHRPALTHNLEQYLFFLLSKYEIYKCGDECLIIM